MNPLAIDLYCGLGGWAEGLIIEGWDVIGFDNVRHVYGQHRYQAQLVIQDVRTLHGRQFREAGLIVASPPCQKYSWMAMPWKRSKAAAAAIRADETGKKLADLNEMFDACFRIQAEASIAAGRHIPMVVENVRGAQPWVGRSRWAFGSFHLWGDVPALMPMTLKAFKSSGMNWSDPTKRGQDFTRVAGNQAINGVGPKWDAEKGCGAYGMARWTNPAEGVKQHGSGAAWFDKALDERRSEATAIKIGGGRDGWFGDNKHPLRAHHSGHSSRRFASAMIARIPLPLARHIGRVFSHAR